MNQAPRVSSATERSSPSLGELLQGGRLRSVHQPIVRIDSGAVVAYEALVRGPRGTAFENPAALFAAARDEGLLAELDHAAQVAAVQGVGTADGPPVNLFVNVEPAGLRGGWVDLLVEALRPAEDRTSICVELTERALVDDPAAVVTAAETIKRIGWRLALDDVGADPASLAMLPLLRPDIVKLDLALVQERTSNERARIVNSVRAEAQRTGAMVLAEGIEDEGHEAKALSFGADLAQGWRYGRPERRVEFAGGEELPWLAPISSAAASPAAALNGRVAWRVAPKHLLLPTTRLLEDRALADPDPCVVLSSFQDAAYFTPATAARYAVLRERCGFVGAMARGLSDRPAGVRGARLLDDDPVINEWNVVVVGPHFFGALVATDLGDNGPDRDRRFRYVVTYDREQVLDVARQLLLRIAPLPASGPAPS